MADVFDVAECILKLHRHPMSTMKLQKLVYYAQAWSLAWDEEPLFEEEIEAWANGPVVRKLYNAHRGEYAVSEGFFKRNPTELTAPQQETVSKVLEFYGNKSPQWLSDLTHAEDPWKDARRGFPDGARTDVIIPKSALLEFYSSL